MTWRSVFPYGRRAAMHPVLAAHAGILVDIQSIFIFQIANSQAGVTLSSTWIIEDEAGNINVVTPQSVPSVGTLDSSRSRVTYTLRVGAILRQFNLTYGWVTGFLLAGAGSAVTNPGMCHARVFVGREGVTSNITNYRNLTSGYVWSTNGISWPEFMTTGPLDGPGWIRTISLGTPAPGADYAIVTVPASARWKVRGFAGQLTTGAGVANRRFNMGFTDGTNVISRGGASLIQIASQVVAYGAHIGVASAGTGNTIAADAQTVGFADTFLTPGYKVAFGTLGLAAADQWGAGFLTVEEWIDV